MNIAKELEGSGHICFGYFAEDDYGNREFVYHYEHGPAIEMKNGDKYWFMDGELHRTDGPAIEYANGKRRWYFKGKPVKVSSQEKFNKWLKYRTF